MKVSTKKNDVLPDSQTEVVAKIAEGKTSAQMAKELNRSESAVNKRIEEAIKRLEAENRAHLVALAILKGIISVKGFALCMGLLGAMTSDDDMRNVRQLRTASRITVKTGRNWEIRV